MLETYCQKNTAIIMKMVSKSYYKEPQGSFKAYIKKQDRYCLKCKKPTNNKSITPKQVVGKIIAQKSTCVVWGPVFVGNKIKEKSKCAICFTGRTFIDEIEDKFDLESELEVYLQFFTGWCYKENEDLLREVQSKNWKFKSKDF